MDGRGIKCSKGEAFIIKNSDPYFNIAPNKWKKLQNNENSKWLLNVAFWEKKCLLTQLH